MHDEIFEAAQDAAVSARDTNGSAASSPSEAYANLTLESRESTATTATMAADQETPRPPPRSSSPAKRPHSDMDDTGRDTQNGAPRLVNGPSSPGTRATKPLPTPSQKSARAASVEMLDVPANGMDGASPDTASVSNSDSSPCANLPSLDEQVAKVLAIHGGPLSDGQEGYVISEQWLARVFARTTENKNKPEQFDKSAVEGEIGPVDNSSLVDQALLSDDLSDQNGEDFVPLRPGLTISQDFEIFSTEAWDLITGWYGLKEGTPVIRRYVHNTAPDDSSANLQYEVYPPVFTIRKVRKAGMSHQIVQEASKSSPKLVASRSDGYVDFLRAAKKAAGIDMKTKVRVWRVLNTAPTDQAPPQPSGMLTPDSSPRNGSPIPPLGHRPVPLLIDVAGFLALADGTERELVTGKDETANEKYNGHVNLGIAGLAEDQVLILEEQEEDGSYITDSSRKTAQNNGIQLGTVKAGAKSNKGLQSNSNSGRNSPAPSGPLTRGRTRTGRTRGTVGLTNLGNTCYMNSALQCIRSVEELSYYFLMEMYKEDLNPKNPLGHGGSIAKSYAGLLASIYNVDGTSSFSPKNFKQALGRAQPLFSGYGQQDSQEFLSFLVDGLHEDLNRVKVKPYIENPESDDNTVHDPAAIRELGEKFRSIHHSRNNSVAMDLFNGFYKNTMVCPDCEKVSITFDPYSLLTLQLPIEQTWQHTITFVPLRGSMVNVEVDIDKNATIKSLKEYIAKRFEGVKANRLMGAEVYTHKFYRVLENNKSIAECNIGPRDVIFFYELDHVPTNWPAPKKQQQYKSMLFPAASSEEDIPKSASPLADKLLVPIFHRAPNMSTYRSQQWSLVLWPSYIVLTREEAKDSDAILKKVLGKVAQMTTRPILRTSDRNPNGRSHTGSDVVLTTEEDASPNGDPRVHDGSVEGEDNMVEVTMAEGVESASSETSEEEIPAILRPGTFIPPEFRLLFEMKHTRPGKEMVPTGWSSIDANKPYEPISKRARLPTSRQSSVQPVDGEESSNASSSEDVDDVPTFSAGPQSSYEQADQSSEDEMQSVETESFARGGRQNSRKNKRKNKKFQKKGQQTHGKKGKDRLMDQPLQSFSDGESDEDDTFIRLGEGIVLDWTQESYNALFEGNLHNELDERGSETLRSIDTLDDPELREKKAKRAARKKHGITLEECFAETSKTEVLSEDNAWYCGRCKELRRASKTLEIWTAPDILVVHLKRFSAHRTFRDKIEAFVDCPVEGLDLAGKVGLPEDKSLIYDLFAVDNHYGGLGGGHYTACARNFFDGKWYDYNDSMVAPKASPDNIVTSAAYLLFYRRRSSRPLGPEYLQNIAEQFRNPDSDPVVDDDSDEQNSRNPSRSPAGNGSRLGDSSRNGSSSAFGAGAGVLPGVGSASAGSHQLKGVAVGTAGGDFTMEGQSPPPYVDEGYGGAEDEEDNSFQGVMEDGLYQGPYEAPGYYENRPAWNFDSITNAQANDDEVFDDAASDEPNLGSMVGDDLHSRILEDFGDQMGEGIHPGMSTPLEEEIPALLGGERGDGEVANVLLDDEASPARKLD